MNKKLIAIFFALLAALFYALNAPLSKLLLNKIATTMLAGLLYLGAGIGIGILSLFSTKTKREALSRSDFPYVMAMVFLDIIAPILLMMGLSYTSASSAALLNNFEIVVTSLVALFFFKEKIAKELWIGIFFIVIASILLSYEGDSLSISWGAILVLLATICWGFENNCTRQIASKSTYEIVFIKGIFSGLGSFIIALLIGESIPSLKYLLLALLLGFVAYGLSIFFYIKAQNVIGAAKTSAYYAVAPFVGALLSFILLKEQLANTYLLAFVIMLIGTIIVVKDTLKSE